MLLNYELFEDEEKDKKKTSQPSTPIRRTPTNIASSMGKTPKLKN